MLLVKNEADILEWSLADASRYLDYIYVLDNGSDDGTWELVQAIAAANSRVVPMGRELAPFSDALRSRIFNAFRERAQEGDWWCRFDADEIYAEDPRAKLAAVAPHQHVVFGQFLLYELTHDEADRLGGGNAGDRPPTISPANCPRFYLKSYLHAEARFFRHRPKLVWNTGSWPRHMGINAPEHVLIKHFRYRSPAQIQLRLDTRHAATAAGWPNFAHDVENSWTQKLRQPDEVYFDAHDGRYASDFAAVATSREPRSHVLVKRLLHGTGIWP
ncbi:MAG: glycosyltransferase family 2 protein [Vicinamibacterales bacterium]